MCSQPFCRPRSTLFPPLSATPHLPLSHQSDENLATIFFKSTRTIPYCILHAPQIQVMGSGQPQPWPTSASLAGTNCAVQKQSCDAAWTSRAWRPASMQRQPWASCPDQLLLSRSRASWRQSRCNITLLFLTPQIGRLRQKCAWRSCVVR